MTNVLAERKRGLEEEYFHRKEQEALEKTRQRLAAEEAESPRVAPSTLRHPGSYIVPSRVIVPDANKAGVTPTLACCPRLRCWRSTTKGGARRCTPMAADEEAR